MEFSTGEKGHKEIVHIITSNDLLQDIRNNEYMRILKKMLHNSINNTCEGNILNWRGDTNDPKEINDLVLELKQMNFKYAFFWFEGNLVHHGVEDRFLEWTKYRTKDWSIMGHILDRNGKCPVLHQQCVIFNLANLDDDVNFNSLVEEHNDFEASKDHVHDDYTPLWIKSKAGKHTRKIKPDSIFDNIDDEHKTQIKTQTKNIIHNAIESSSATVALSDTTITISVSTNTGVYGINAVKTALDELSNF